MKAKIFSCAIVTAGEDIHAQITTTTMQTIFGADIYVVPVRKNVIIKEIMADLFFIPPRKIRLVLNDGRWYIVAF